MNRYMLLIPLKTSSVQHSGGMSQLNLLFTDAAVLNTDNQAD